MSKKVEKKVSTPLDIKTPDTANITSGVVTKNDVDELKKELAEIKTIVKGFKKELKGLVEIQQRLVHERLGVPVPLPPKEYGEESSSKSKINILPLGDDRIRISGNTFDFKAAIKGAGAAKWEQETKSWSLPSNCLDQLVKNFEDLNLVKGTDFSVPWAVNESNKKSNSDEEDGGFGSGFQD
jgi:hypothetical protein